MKNLGMWLMIFGFGSMVLNLIGFEFKLLVWVDTWGPAVGWAIRAGLAAVGAVLFFLGMRQEPQAQKA